jgi:hypothetical protein
MDVVGKPGFSKKPGFFIFSPFFQQYQDLRTPPFIPPQAGGRGVAHSSVNFPPFTGGLRGVLRKS